MRRFAWFATFSLLALHAANARQVALITDGELASPARHGIDKLRDALRAKGFDVTANEAQVDYVILAGIGPSVALRTFQAPTPAGRETFTIAKGTWQNKPAVILRGGDARGLMYAALDTADRVSWSTADL